MILQVLAWDKRIILPLSMILRMNYRHFTPSMLLLVAFEAAVRHENYTRAAIELSP